MEIRSKSTVNYHSPTYLLNFFPVVTLIGLFVSKLRVCLLLIFSCLLCFCNVHYVIFFENKKDFYGKIIFCDDQNPLKLIFW